jgi:predicted nucleotidyltransferase/predicted transcriptional regulator
MNILAEILSSRVRAEIFRILFGTDVQEYHLREIQRRSKLAIGTVQQETTKLEKLDLIIKQQNGNRNYYRANNAHPLYREIHNLVLKTIGLSDILRIVLSSETIIFAFVFGSFATGNEKSESDVDIFIIGEIGLRAVCKLLKEPSLKIGREINPHVMTLKEFNIRKSEKEHFIKNIIESPKIMIIGTEHEFARLGE